MGRPGASDAGEPVGILEANRCQSYREHHTTILPYNITGGKVFGDSCQADFIWDHCDGCRSHCKWAFTVGEGDGAQIQIQRGHREFMAGAHSVAGQWMGRYQEGVEATGILVQWTQQGSYRRQVRVMRRHLGNGDGKFDDATKDLKVGGSRAITGLGMCTVSVACPI